MGKFSLSLPGRSKKTPQQVYPSENLSKAHKILGSSQLSIDATSKGWDGPSKSSAKVNVTEAGGPGSAIGNRSRSLSRRAQMERVWEEDSDILPQHMAYLGDDSTDYTGRLKEYPSTSTIRSWYDKSRQPLSISQQTSASSMAKGLPSKAQRLLDMDNSSYTPPKSKKKPAKLDLSGSNSTRGDDGKLYNRPVLGNDYVSQSPAPYSPATPQFTSKRPRWKIQKHPTKENPFQHDPMPSGSYRPATSEVQALPQQASMSELPNLYKHYEQMSFAGMDDEAISPKTKPTGVRTSQSESNLRNLPPTTYPSQATKRTQDELPSPLASHPARSIPTHLVQAPTPTSAGPPSPLADCASISSRHTQTSKASKRTEKSFQATDLLEQSVLLLSSDSEEEDEDYDAFNEPTTRLTASGNTSRRPSETEIRHSMMVDAPLPSPGPVENGFDQNTSPKTTSSSRTSQAPPGFSTVSPDASNPNSIMTPPQTQTNRQSQGSQLSRNPSLPTRIPTLPPWSPLRWTQEWPMSAAQEPQEPQEPQPFQPPTKAQEQQIGRKSSQKAYSNGISYAAHQSTKHHKQPERASSASRQSAQLTPPLSPLGPPGPSVDFDGNPTCAPNAKGGDLQEQFMGLTRQEQMLIQALRQKRSSMRKQSVASSSDYGLGPRRQHTSKGHQSNPSEVTITPENFQFDFPIPPVSLPPPEESTLSSTTSTLELPRNFDGELTTDGVMFMLSPPPSTHSARNSISNTMSRGNSPNRTAPSTSSSQSTTPKDTYPEPERRRKDGKIMLYLDQPGVPCMTITEGVMSPDSPNFDPNATITYALSQQKKPRDSLKVPRVSSTRRKRDRAPEGRTSTTINKPLVSNESHPPPIVEEEPIPLLPSTRYGEVPLSKHAPRPDSSVSTVGSVFPDEFPIPPHRRQTVNNYNQSVRLSAVGPPQAMLGGPGWWGDED